MTPDLSQAKHLIDAIAQSGIITFQTFGDLAAGIKDSVTPRIIHARNNSEFDAVLEKLCRQNEKGAGVFFMVNEGDGLGRAASNILNIRSFYVDLDEDGGEKLARIMALPERLKPHLVVESSPGKYHVYWLINLGFPIDKFPHAQKALIAKFGGDPVVHDLPRVMRVAGFHHQKDPDNPFMTRIVYTHEAPRFDGETLIRELGLQIKPRPINEDLNPFTGTIPEGRRNDALFRLACGMRGRGVAPRQMRENIFEANRIRCAPPLPQEEVEFIINSVETRFPLGTAEQNQNATHTDVDNANHLIRCYGEVIRYVPELGKWLIWDGIRWSIDTSDQIVCFAKETIRQCMHEAMQIADIERRDRTVRKLLASESATHVEAMVRLARSDRRVVVHQHQLDSNIYLLNVINGMIDLRTGKLLPHDRNHYMTKLVEVKYEPA